MTDLRIIKAENAALLPPGRIAALLGDRAVWIGKLGDPIEDIEADGLLLSPVDYDHLQRLIGEQTNALSLEALIAQLNRLGDTRLP